MRILCVLLLLCLCAVLLSSSLISIASVVLLSIPLWVPPSEKRAAPNFFLLGLLAPLLPMAGSGALLAYALVFLLSQRQALSFSGLAWALPYVLLVWAWTLAEVFWGLDKATFSILAASSGGLSNVFDYLRNAPPAWLTLLLHAVRLSVCLLLFSVFQSRRAFQDSFFRGLVFGLTASCCIGMAQVFGFGGQLFVNQGAYWNSLGRWVFTFSDPNAAGVFIVLALPVVWAFGIENAGKRRFGYFCLALALLALGVLSGSRSFLLGLACACVLALLKWRRRFAFIALGTAFAFVLALDFARLLSPLAYAGGLSFLPSGSRRLLEAISFTNLGETFFSRLIFWRIGLAMWLDHLFLGVGFHKFSELVPVYAQHFGLNIGSWSDNSNNFYLGLLAETGLVGFSLFILSCSRLEFAVLESLKSRASKISVVTLLVLFFFGPHLDFDEVSLLFAALMGASLQVKQFKPRIDGLIALLLLGALIFTYSWRASRGFYAWESDGAMLFRWTGREAQGQLACAPTAHATGTPAELSKNEAILLMRAPVREVNGSPLLVALRSAAGTAEITFSNSDPFDVRLDCGVNTSLFYQLEVRPAWLPRTTFGVGDPRLLGVQVVNR